MPENRGKFRIRFDRSLRTELFLIICLAGILCLGAYYFVVQRLAGGLGTVYTVTVGAKDYAILKVE